MATKQKLYLGGLLIAFMIVHAAKKRERERDIRTCVYWSPSLYKRLNTMENYKTVSPKSGRVPL